MLNKEEFKDVFNVHFDAVRNFVYYRCGDMETASDVAQDVFMRIWEKRDEWNSHPVKPLLYKMASDFYVSQYRKNLTRINFEQSLTPEPDSERSPEDELLFRELTASYTQALEQMSERQRTVFLMHREDGMKYTEIAHSLCISVKTVEKHVSAALQLLRTKLL